MAELSEYLGHLLCEVTRARVMADAEAVKVAKMYVNDESQLMKTFPVPRMRLPSVEITVPLEIKDVPDGYKVKTNTNAPLLANLIVEELGPQLKKEGIHISTSEITKIIKDDPDLSRGIIPQNFAEKLSAQMYDHSKVLLTKKNQTDPGSTTKLSMTGAKFSKISTMIKDGLEKAVHNIPSKPVGITIESQTAKIREIGNPGLLLNCKLIINEDALDIQLENQDSSTRASDGTAEKMIPSKPVIKKLIPE